MWMNFYFENDDELIKPTHFLTRSYRNYMCIYIYGFF